PLGREQARAEYEVARRARVRPTRPREPGGDQAADGRVGAEARGLEGEKLTVRGERLLELREARAAARAHHELRGLVGDDPAVGGDLEYLALEALAVEVLAPRAAQAQRPARFARGAHPFAQVFQAHVRVVHGGAPRSAAVRDGAGRPCARACGRT